MPLHFGQIRNRFRAGMSFSLRGIVLSAVLHLVVITSPGSTPRGEDAARPDPGQEKAANPALEARNVSGAEVAFALASGSTRAGIEHPLAWNRPVFAQGELGPAIAREKGRGLKTHTKRPPSLRPPEFTPYIPPEMAELVIDADRDVFKRTQPADDDRHGLEREERLFRDALAEDLRDCRLDRISLAEALLRLSYFRLQDALLRQGKKPDFSYGQVRDILADKMAAIRREEVNGASPENWATALLVAHRQDKIYEERRGQSLLNSIWYDLYNCRTGSEELLLYLSRYHPELELGTVRGSVLKHDGTLMGHMDPAVKIDGRWLVLKTVALDTLLVDEYQIGELYPLEKIVLDYLPDLADAECHLGSPLARNGEPLAGEVDLYTRGDHPLAVKDKPPPIILWRESTSYQGPYRMMGREDRLLHEMLSRYPPLAGERQLLTEDDPFADLLLHLLLTAPDERQSLLDLYLRKRVTTAPSRFKRPLRTAAYLPSYGDLLATLEQRAGGMLEIAPGSLVPMAHFSGHGEYLAANDRRMAELTQMVSPPGKLELAGEIKNFLFTAPEPGVTAIFPPVAESRALVAGLLDDAYDLSLPVAEEQARRANTTSAREIAIVKAGLLDHSGAAQDLLAQRITLLKEVLAHKAVDFAGGEARSRHEVPASLSFAETVARGGRDGLSPGFIKDMVELLGEGEAVQAFRNYLQPMFAAGPGKNGVVTLDRQRTAEMLGYFDHYLLLAESRKQVVLVARQLYEHHPDPATRVGAAQFLVSQGALDPTSAGTGYVAALARQPFDVRELRSLLETGLGVEQARTHLHQRIATISLKGLEHWHPERVGNGRVAPELLQLDELMRGAIMLGDDGARERIAEKLTDLLTAVLATGAAPVGRNEPHYANGLNALSALSRSGVAADEAIFPRFLAFGARDPAGFFYAKLLGNWLGEERYRGLLAKALQDERARFASTLADLATLRGQGEATRSSESNSARPGWVARYGATLENLADRVSTISFLDGLADLEGQSAEAQRVQAAMLAELFAQAEFHKKFAATADPAITAVRDEALLIESVFRAVELAGYLAKQSGRPGRLDLNHAPTLRVEGEFLSSCGAMPKIVDGRNGPLNVLFTKAPIYFDSLLDAENSPAIAAEAFRHERELRELLTRQPLAPGTGKELDDTEAFIRDLDQSGFCDIRRLYLLETLLRRAVLPERLPNWLLDLAQDSFLQEMAYLTRIRSVGGVAAVFQESRRVGREEFIRRWGEHPFSIRNLYGTMVLVKMGRLRVNRTGEFEATK
jgi:hypothetical protein